MGVPGTMSQRERLLLFGRLPEPGRTKTRLASTLGEAGAARLYEAFLDDLVERARGVAETELWVPRRPGAEKALTRRHPGLPVRIQSEGDLGARLAGAFERSFDDGVARVVALGSDHPTLPADYPGRAFRALRAAHLVIGPAEDGGYYAVGLRRTAWPGARSLFDGAPWSTPRLLAWTREAARSLGLRHVELPVWYDVDVPEDLDRLARDAVPGTRTARALAEMTRIRTTEAESR